MRPWGQAIVPSHKACGPYKVTILIWVVYGEAPIWEHTPKRHVVRWDWRTCSEYDNYWALGTGSRVKSSRKWAGLHMFGEMPVLKWSLWSQCKRFGGLGTCLTSRSLVSRLVPPWLVKIVRCRFRSKMAAVWQGFNPMFPIWVRSGQFQPIKRGANLNFELLEARHMPRPSFIYLGLTNSISKPAFSNMCGLSYSRGQSMYDGERGNYHIWVYVSSIQHKKLDPLEVCCWSASNDLD
jgi:hypothetical protein